MSRIKQEVRENEQGVRHNVCPHCKEIITYPNGVYFRSGIEVHTKCVNILRTTKDKIAGIDYSI